MNAFATVEDVTTLWRPLSTAEQERANALLPLLSDALRVEAQKVGKDIDQMITDDISGAYGNTVKIVTVDILGRVLRQSTTDEPLSQESQSALGYTWSGTFAIPGGGIAAAIMKNDLKRLGLRRQRLGMIDLMPEEGSA